jgi:alpha-L-rhamnosidase
LDTTDQGHVSDIRAVGLKTDYLAEPLGLESARPLLSWQVSSGRRNVRQSAYQISVASSREALRQGHADIWDSGRIVSPDCFAIPYDGPQLHSRQRLFWCVTIWDESGIKSPPSEIASWEMGLLAPSDWSAQWLAVEDEAMCRDREGGFHWISGPNAAVGSTTKFRFVFDLPADGMLTAYVAGIAPFVTFVDGQEIEVPKPGPGAFGMGPTTQIVVELRAGRHVLAIGAEGSSLGARLDFSGVEIAVFTRADLGSGKRIYLTPDGSKTSDTEPEGWSEAGFDDSSWSAVELVRAQRPSPWPPQKALYFRREFTVQRKVRSARLYASALGAYELYLNGAQVGDAWLGSESTDFRKRAFYRVHDVTNDIAPGPNVLSVMAGDGWFASAILGLGRYPWGPPPRCLILQLEIDYADGSRETIATDETWKVAPAPIVSSEIYDGERYDARLEQPGWSAQGFDDGKWSNARIAAVPNIALVAQYTPPIRTEKVLAAQSITEPLPGTYVFDFGQNFSGVCTLDVLGQAGTEIELRFAEILKDDGTVDQANLRGARATDRYVLKGDPAGERFTPHFTYHGFRYVQVSGLPSKPSPTSLKGVVFHSDLPITGRLDIGNPIIEKLWQNTLWSQRSNFVGIPTDCPQRDERLGWMGDANVFWDAASFNMDVAAFTRRFMAEARMAQDANGAFANFNPAPVRLPGADGTVGAAPGWADAGVCLPWTTWQRYGDTGIIMENWDAMSRYIRFICDANPDFIWRNGRGADFGDWLALDANQPGDPTTPKDLVGTACWAHSVDCMAQMADAIGRRNEAGRYRELLGNICRAFERAYVAADGSIGNGSQTGYVLALRYDLVPPSFRAAAVTHLVEDIKRRGTLLSTGFLGTPIALDVLADAGHSDLVYSLLLRTEFPSWGYMVAKGATTIWERWNGDTGDVAMNSFNHYALGAVCGFLFRRVAGIAPLEPGYRRIAIRPLFDARVPCAGADYDSVLGKISSKWHWLDDKHIQLDVAIPPNATAEVHLPADRKIMHNPEAHRSESSGGDSVLEVGSGHYSFTIG